MNSLILLASWRDNSAIIAFVGYMTIVMFLAWLSSRVAKKSSFLSEYFLGGRNLGVWAFALTFAATSASGGSFIGFPSLVYTHGWSLALWIGSYMLVPLVAMGFLAKRLNQIARKTDAITIPDLVLERFQSPTLGLVSTLLIVFFTTFNLIAQFKGGSVILQTLLSDVPAFQTAATSFGELAANFPLAKGVDPSYLLCLLVFALGVVFYTTYGGFRAVVWTDVLQGFVMVGGILILLPLTLLAVGGLGAATTNMASMKPPMQVLLGASVDENDDFSDGEVVEKNQAILVSDQGEMKAYRLAEAASFNEFGYLLPTEKSLPGGSDTAVRAIELDCEPETLATQLNDLPILRVTELSEKPHGEMPDVAGLYTTWPGPSSSNPSGFLPFVTAISFFFFWCFSSAGQPGNMIRSMAFRDSKTLSRAIFTVSIYYSLIYFPIVIIFCCARTLLPGWETASDRIMPEMASVVTASFGVPWLAGLLVAAPFAAVMSTMDSFLLLISSSVVRDIYTRWIEPNPTEKRTKVLTYATTFVVGIVAMIAAINPPQFLQDIIVFTGSGLSTAFLAPVTLALYWPRFNYQGALAGMLSGFFSNIALYGIGSWYAGKMAAYEPWGISPFLIGTVLSFVFAWVVCVLTPSPSQELIHRFFCRPKTSS